MLKRKEPALDTKEQAKRFKETAKELGADSSDKFELAIEALLRPATKKSRARKT